MSHYKTPTHKTLEDPAPSERMWFFYHPDYFENGAIKKCLVNISRERSGRRPVEYITDMDGLPYVTSRPQRLDQYFWYSPWGETIKQEKATTNTWETPYKFNGKELDDETGLYYYGARYYNPQVSVWLSVDPLSHLSPNKTPYHFVSNNPIMRIDPDGNRDYYSQQGELIKQDNLPGSPVFALDRYNPIKAIELGEFAVIPTPAVINAFDEAYNSSEMNGNIEFGGAVGDGGAVSQIVPGLTDYINLTPAYDEIKSLGQEVLYDFHVHGSENGKSNTFMPSNLKNALGKTNDLDEYSKAGLKEKSVVLGYKQVRDRSKTGTTVYGQESSTEEQRYLGFYNEKGLVGKEVEYELIKNLSKEVYEK